MTSESTNNFWQVWQTFQWPEPKPVFFRLYYNEDDGSFVCYSMEELPYAFVEVDREIYLAADKNVKVVNGQAVFKKPCQTIACLQPAEFGTPCDPRDVCVISTVERPHQKWTEMQNEIS